jgi:malate/lactate dehydrogenase
MSVPTIVGRNGVEAHLDLPVDAAEHAALRASADAIRAACAAVGA